MTIEKIAEQLKDELKDELGYTITDIEKAWNRYKTVRESENITTIKRLISKLKNEKLRTEIKKKEIELGIN